MMTRFAFMDGKQNIADNGIHDGMLTSVCTKMDVNIGVNCVDTTVAGGKWTDNYLCGSFLNDV